MNRKSLSIFLFYYLPPFVYAGLIFFLSSLPSWKIKAASSFPDYILHFIEYAVFSILSFRFVAKATGRKITIKVSIVIIIILALFALSDEWHQSFVPGRFATWSDFAADTAGILGGLGIYQLFFKYKQKERFHTETLNVDKK